VLLPFELALRSAEVKPAVAGTLVGFVPVEVVAAAEQTVAVSLEPAGQSNLD